MFLAQRPQQPVRLSPNLDLSWQGITHPVRPASRTSDSVIPLHKQTYTAFSFDDYDKRYQYATEQRICQASLFALYCSSARIRRNGGFNFWLWKAYPPDRAFSG